MGGGSWTKSDWSTHSRSIKSASREEVFKSRNMPAEFDPRKIAYRESCDSEEKPVTTPIIVGVDVTGSMGYIAELLVKQELGTFCTELLDRQPIQNPHIMFMGVGDITGDAAPLQVTQFEADIRIAKQLQSIYLEANGQGNGWESYDLPWYFAGNRTKIDSFDKRGEKGFLFTVGDEMPPAEGSLSRERLRRVFGNTIESGSSAAEALARASEKYIVFHIIIEEGDYARRNQERVKNAWGQVLGPNVLSLKCYTHISQLIISAIAIAKGNPVDSVIASWENPSVRDTLTYAFQHLIVT
jgi:hypothetical protein